MIRGQRSAAVVVRRPSGELLAHREPLGALATSPLSKIPLIRGILVLAETLALGTRTLLYSMRVAVEEEGESLPPGLIWGTLAGSLIFALVLFFLAPLLFAHWLDAYVGSSLISNLVEGGIRIAIFVLYLKAIGLMPDIRRVFAYHGAEHKTINAYEDGVALNLDNIRGYPTAHPRCGTAFLLFVLILAVFVFALLGRPPLWLRFISRIALLPLIASLGYEVVRFAAAHRENPIVRLLLAPSLALQSMTTREPDDGQLEVALSALEEALRADAETTPE
ncbi:MAG: DUF1385 domain-containing protein [Chloroflexi bacterium]|nr:DUF1385 domain-containing protein [Chloroflexota bacterium]